MGERAGLLKFRLFPGPVGGLNPEGALGGDLGAVWRTGERSLGVERAESRSLYANW